VSPVSCTGLALQNFVSRFYSFLKREKSKDVRGLFAFSTGRRAQAGLQSYYRNNLRRLRPASIISEQDVRVEISNSG